MKLPKGSYLRLKQEQKVSQRLNSLEVILKQLESVHLDRNQSLTKIAKTITELMNHELKSQNLEPIVYSTLLRKASVYRTRLEAFFSAKGLTFECSDLSHETELDLQAEVRRLRKSNLALEKRLSVVLCEYENLSNLQMSSKVEYHLPNIIEKKLIEAVKPYHQILYKLLDEYVEPEYDLTNRTIFDDLKQIEICNSKQLPMFFDYLESILK